jgi:hypothetical protein
VSAFLYSEKVIAEQLGLSRTNVCELRALYLEEGNDWKLIRGAIVLSEQGVNKLAKLIDQAAPDLKTCPADAASAEKEGAARRLIVIAKCINPRMVLANESGDPNQERQLVDVGINKNFASGDEIEAGPHDVQPGILQLFCNVPRTNRRPQIEGSLRDPNNWGAREMNAIIERARNAGK